MEGLLSMGPTLSSFLLLTRGADNSRPDYTAQSCPTATVWEFVQKNKMSQIVWEAKCLG